MMEDPRYIHTTSDRQNKPEKLNKLGHRNKICLSQSVYKWSIVNLTTDTRLVLNVYCLLFTSAQSTRFTKDKSSGLQLTNRSRLQQQQVVPKLVLRPSSSRSPSLMSKWRWWGGGYNHLGYRYADPFVYSQQSWQNPIPHTTNSVD